MKSFILMIVLTVAFLALPSMVHAQSGAEGLDYDVLQVYTNGDVYQTNTLTFEAIPVGAKVGVVAWSWAFTTMTPHGTVVALCYASPPTPQCIDVSEFPQGNTTHWSGHTARGAKFYMTFQVPATQFPTILYTSTNTQTTVNYADQ